ncbi:nuclease-related domain-containing protein [Lentibacillus salicampi]|uniref:NERD domain-containing protein n=1 Tax=Lentibacillus salicampi TaxID=175306 RepID=A0A4Y9ABD5_9BACI|nr:nuclease-related domain-containing protein [Lentibacillus salicampi]TFJ92725.1 NERD domain-containing protein [Lentibacillus salicampi]
MFIKPLAVPKHILQAQALDRRTPANHFFKGKINSRATNLSSGYKGEESMNFHLQFLPEDDFLIFHYVRLPDLYGHFQIDFLLLSRYYHLIMEVKNVYENMNFDGMGQAFRIQKDDVQMFTNPVEQVILQHRRLLDWLRKNHFPPAPIEKIVVYSRDDTYLRNLTNDKIISDIVMHRDKVLSKIESFNRKYRKICVTDKQLTEMAYLLLDQHVPEEDGGKKKFNMTYDDLVKGVICPACSFVPMFWKSGKWQCVSCGCVSKTAHRPALADYALLVGGLINNRQARDFLRVESNSIMKKLLQYERFSKIGKGSGMRYKLDFDRLLD